MDDTRIGFTVTPADNGYIVEHQKTPPSDLPQMPGSTLITDNGYIVKRHKTLITGHPISGSAEHRLVKFIAELVGHEGSVVKAPPGDTDICRGVVQ